MNTDTCVQCGKGLPHTPVFETKAGCFCKYECVIAFYSEVSRRENRDVTLEFPADSIFKKPHYERGLA